MTDQQPHRILQAPTWRGGKTALMEAAVAAMVRAGKTVTIVRPDGSTRILPFRRPAAR